MSQIYPSPVLYTYRVHSFGLLPGANTNTVTVAGMAQGTPGILPVNFIIEYSKDSGTTWQPADNSVFHSLQDAYQQIAQIVNNETSFQTTYATNTANLPTWTTYSYPV